MAEWCIPFWVTLTLTLTSSLISMFFVSGAYLLYYSYLSSNVSYARPIPLGGIRHVTVTFLVQNNYGLVSYWIKEFHKCSNMVANIWPTDPLPSPAFHPRHPSPLTMGMGSVGQNSTFWEHLPFFWATFSEYGNVAYQIRGNHQIQQHGTFIP